jgi:hypothetical protein
MEDGDIHRFDIIALNLNKKNWVSTFYWCYEFFPPFCSGSEFLVAGPDFTVVKISKAHLVALDSVLISAPHSWFPFLRRGFIFPDSNPIFFILVSVLRVTSRLGLLNVDHR